MGAVSRRAGGGQVPRAPPPWAGAAGAPAVGARAAVEGEGSLLEDKSHAEITVGAGVYYLPRAQDLYLSATPQSVIFNTGRATSEEGSWVVTVSLNPSLGINIAFRIVQSSHQYR